MTDPVRFPAGPLPLPPRRDAAQLARYAADLQDSAAQLAQVGAALSPAHLAQTYRSGSFTARQLVHHIADAHELGFMRFRWGLTERRPSILPMDQDAWARLADYALPPAPSLALHAAVNARWVAVLTALDPAELTREIVHPQEGVMDLWALLAKHEWHVRHHLGHLRLALERL
jgi:uncharacterized damage-inducible protein DinB